MAQLLPNSLGVKAVADYMRRGNAYNYPLDATVIDRLIQTGVSLGAGIPSGVSTKDGSTGDTKLALTNSPISALLKLIRKYSGGSTASQTPLIQALQLLDQSLVYETPMDGKTCELVNAYALSVGFVGREGKGSLMNALGNSPYTTLLYLLYWVGTSNPVNPYTF